MGIAGGAAVVALPTAAGTAPLMTGSTSARRSLARRGVTPHMRHALCAPALLSARTVMASGTLARALAAPLMETGAFPVCRAATTFAVEGGRFLALRDFIATQPFRSPAPRARGPA